MKKIGKSEVIIFSILFIILICGISIGIKSFEPIHQKEVLKKEILGVMEKDLATDDYTVIIKTKGDYGYIEKVIKNHFLDLKKNISKITVYLNNENLTDVLSPPSLKEDRPSYKNSYSVIRKRRAEIRETIKQITYLCEEETIKDLFDKEKVKDTSSYRLYLSLINTKQDKEHFSKLKENVESMTEGILDYLVKLEEIIDFFEKNDSSIHYEEDKMYFDDNNLLQQYNDFMIELNSMEGRISGKDTDDSSV